MGGYGLGKEEGASEKLFTYVTDKAGYDLRYAIDSSKLKDELACEPSLQFEKEIDETEKWYLDNLDWLKNVTLESMRNIIKQCTNKALLKYLNNNRLIFFNKR